MRAAKGMIVVLTTLLASACALVESPADDRASSDEKSGQQTSEAPATPTADPSATDVEPVDPEAYPLAFDAEAKSVFPETPVYDGALVGTRLITMTLDQLRARALPELETAWQMAPLGLFVDVDTRDEQLYALDLRVEEGAGTRAGRLAMTLSRISPATGTVLDEVAWEKTQDVQSSGDPVVRIASIMDGVVLVESSGSDEGSRHTLTAVDVASGEELWTRRPGTFVAATDTSVVLSTAAGSESGTLLGVDPESGAVEWTGPRTIVTADLVGVHEDTLRLVTSSTEDSDPELLALSTADGSVTARRATSLGDWGCHPAEESIVVCSLPGERAVGFDLATGKEVWQLPTAGRYGVWVSSVRGGYVYGFTTGGRSVVLDAETGRDVTETAGAAPVSSNGYGGLIFYSGQAIFYPAVPDRTEPPQ